MPLSKNLFIKTIKSAFTVFYYIKLYKKKNLTIVSIFSGTTYLALKSIYLQGLIFGVLSLVFGRLDSIRKATFFKIYINNEALLSLNNEY